MQAQVKGMGTGVLGGLEESKLGKEPRWAYAALRTGGGQHDAQSSRSGATSRSSTRSSKVDLCWSPGAL